MVAKTDEQVAVIGDLLAYILIYAPEFPKEDATSLEAQFDGLIGKVHELWNTIQDIERRRWLDALARELLEARAAFMSGNEKTGRSLIQSAQERLKAWRSGKKAKATFIVGPDGGAEKL